VVLAKLVAAVVVNAPDVEGVNVLLVEPPVPDIATVSAVGPADELLLSKPIDVGVNEKPEATVNVQV
jgi:hypothetical protein